MLAAICAMVLFAGCGSLFRQPEYPAQAAARAEARVTISSLSSRNERLKNFKGIGKIKVRQNQKIRIDETIAWVASETAKINIVVLVSGHPVLKMASDGKWLYYYEVREGRPLYKKMPASAGSLKRVTALPITIADIIDLLAGRVPLREHHSAFVEPTASGKGYVLVLKRRWWGVIEKVLLDETKSQVHQVEFYTRTGSLAYRARFEAMQTIGGYQVPTELNITDGDGIDLQLEVNRYWADAVVSPSMFVLNPPE